MQVKRLIIVKSMTSNSCALVMTTLLDSFKYLTRRELFTNRQVSLEWDNCIQRYPSQLPQRVTLEYIRIIQVRCKTIHTSWHTLL